MKINSVEKYDLEKLKTFDRIMIETVKNDKDTFEFENEQYYVCTDGVFVQTLINDRILYKIFIEEEKNDDSVHYELINYIQI